MTSQRKVGIQLRLGEKTESREWPAYPYGGSEISFFSLIFLFKRRKVIMLYIRRFRLFIRWGTPCIHAIYTKVMACVCRFVVF